MRREVDRPYHDKQMLRIREMKDGEILYAWLVKMTMDGSVNCGTYRKGDPIPEWLEHPELSSFSISGVPNR